MDNIIKVKNDNDELIDAEIINTYDNDNKKYIIYSVSNNNDTSNLYASRVEKDDNGNDIYLDINNDEKKEIIKYIQKLLKN